MDGDAGFDKWELEDLVESVDELGRPVYWKSRICPRRLISPESRHWQILSDHYRAGFLADAGGALDQDARYIEAMRIINQVVNSG